MKEFNLNPKWYSNKMTTLSVLNERLEKLPNLLLKLYALLFACISLLMILSCARNIEQYPFNIYKLIFGSLSYLWSKLLVLSLIFFLFSKHLHKLRIITNALFIKFLSVINKTNKIRIEDQVKKIQLNCSLDEFASIFIALKEIKCIKMNNYSLLTQYISAFFKGMKNEKISSNTFSRKLGEKQKLKSVNINALKQRIQGNEYELLNHSKKHTLNLNGPIAINVSEKDFVSLFISLNNILFKADEVELINFLTNTFYVANKKPLRFDDFIYILQLKNEKIMSGSYTKSQD